MAGKAIEPHRPDNAAWDRALRPKRCKFADNRALARVVADKLRLLWSPEGLTLVGWADTTHLQAAEGNDALDERHA